MAFYGHLTQTILDQMFLTLYKNDFLKKVEIKPLYAWCIHNVDKKLMLLIEFCCPPAPLPKQTGMTLLRKPADGILLLHTVLLVLEPWSSWLRVLGLPAMATFNSMRSLDC